MYTPASLVRNDMKVRDLRREIKRKVEWIASPHAEKITPTELASHQKEVEAPLESLRRLVKQRRSYYITHGEKDRKAIQEKVDLVEESYRNFKNKWQPELAAAFQAKDYTAAARALFALPNFEISLSIKGFDDEPRGYSKKLELSDKQGKIRDWYNEAKKAIPAKHYIPVEIEVLEKFTKAYAQEIKRLLNELDAQTAQAETSLENWEDYKHETEFKQRLKELGRYHAAASGNMTTIRLRRRDLDKILNNSAHRE